MTKPLEWASRSVTLGHGPSPVGCFENLAGQHRQRARRTGARSPRQRLLLDLTSFLLILPKRRLSAARLLLVSMGDQRVWLIKSK